MSRKRVGMTIPMSQMVSEEARSVLEEALGVDHTFEFKEDQSFDYYRDPAPGMECGPKIRVSGRPLKEVEHLGEDNGEPYTADVQTRVHASPVHVFVGGILGVPKDGEVVELERKARRLWDPDKDRSHYVGNRYRLGAFIARRSRIGLSQASLQVAT